MRRILIYTGAFISLEIIGFFLNYGLVLLFGLGNIWDTAGNSETLPNTPQYWLYIAIQLIWILLAISGVIIYILLLIKTIFLKQKKRNSSGEKSLLGNRKLIFTVLFVILLFFFPTVGISGLLLTWFWNKWSKKVKVTVASAPTLLLPVLLLGTYIFLFRPFQITGDSMYPNFQDKEYTLANIIGLRFVTPKLGDVIVFKSPIDPEKDFISRVIGVAGDTVMLKDGVVYLNSKLLNESKYLKDAVKTYGGSFLNEGKTITVPSDSYFVMGDNRAGSSDSREWGFVPSANLIGKVSFCYFNCSKSSVVDKKSNSINTILKDWKLFTSVDGNFQILFPSGNPRITYDKNLPLPNEPAKEYRLLQFSDSDVEDTYYVEVGIYPYKFPRELDGLSIWANDIGKNINASLLNSKQSTFMDVPSLELNFKSKNNDSNYKYRIFNINQYSYAIAGASKSDKFPSFNVFANSFQFLQNQLSTNTNISAPNPADNGFLSGTNNSEDIESLEDYVGSIQNAKNSWQNAYSSGNYPQQDLDKLLDEFTRMISFSKTIINNLQSGSGNTADNISLWQAVLEMDTEAAVLTKKLNGQ